MTYNYGNFNQYQPNRQMIYKMIPITNEFEMNNIAVDYNGNPTYFHNQSTNEIYVKYFDIKTGITPIHKFIRADEQGHEISEGKSESNINYYDEKINSINERIDGLKDIVDKLNKKAVKND